MYQFRRSDEMHKFKLFLFFGFYLLLTGYMLQYSRRYLAEAVEKSLIEHGEKVEKRLKEKLQ